MQTLDIEMDIQSPSLGYFVCNRMEVGEKGLTIFGDKFTVSPMRLLVMILTMSIILFAVVAPILYLYATLGFDLSKYSLAEMLNFLEESFSFGGKYYLLGLVGVSAIVYLTMKFLNRVYSFPTIFTMNFEDIYDVTGVEKKGYSPYQVKLLLRTQESALCSFRTSAAAHSFSAMLREKMAGSGGPADQNPVRV